MYWLSSTFTDPDAILSRRDALLRTLGVALRVLFLAWLVLAGLRMANAWRPWIALPCAGACVLVAATVAWRHSSARILPDGVTRLTGRALLAIGLALAACAAAGGTAFGLTLVASQRGTALLTPELAGLLGALCVYPWCMRVARRRRLVARDGDVRDFVASVVSELASAVTDAVTDRSPN